MLKLGNLWESWKLSCMTETPIYRNCKAVCASMWSNPVPVSSVLPHVPVKLQVPVLVLCPSEHTEFYCPYCSNTVLAAWLQTGCKPVFTIAALMGQS